MTANQLKYWELRWKQHYEQILAKVKIAEVEETKRHNLAVEAENERHNRRQERIDTQNMITNRGNLAARWAELDEKQRAAIVAEGLKRDEYNLAVQTELRQAKYTQAQIDKMLSDMELAQMDLAISIVKHKHDVAANYIKAEAALLKNGWTKAAAGEVVADIKSLMSSTEFDTYLSKLKSNPTFSWIGETFGPAAIKEIATVTDSNDVGQWQGPPTKEQMQQSNAKKRFESRPDFQPIIKETDNKDTVSGHSSSEGTGSSTGTSVVYGHTGARYYSNHRESGSTRGPVETKTSNGTSVVYSGGSHYGPGYV